MPLAEPNLLGRPDSADRERHTVTGALTSPVEFCGLYDGNFKKTPVKRPGV